MSAVERTPQRLDPIGILTAWPLGPVTGVVIILYAAYSTFLHLDQLTNPLLAPLALVVIGAATIYYASRTRPGLAPFGRRDLIVVIGLSTIASTLFTLSVWGANQIIQDDWGQIAIALIFITLPFYRPITEVIAGALFAGLAVGIEAGLEGPSLSIVNVPIVYFSVAATPVIAVAVAGCTYAWVMTGDTLRWSERARESQARLDPELRESAARMIHQQRVTLLNSEAVPFFADVLEHDELSRDDIERARVIAAALRRNAVDDVDRSWLEESVARSAGRGRDAVIDPDRLANAMSEELRGIVGAVVASAARERGFDAASLRIELATVADRAHAILSVDIDAPRRALRSIFMPFLAALRAVSSDATLDAQDGSVTLQFSYGRP